MCRKIRAKGQKTSEWLLAAKHSTLPWSLVARAGQGNASHTCFNCSSARRLLSASVDKLPKSRSRSAAVSILRLEGGRIGRGQVRGRDELKVSARKFSCRGIRFVVGQEGGGRWRGIHRYRGRGRGQECGRAGNNQLTERNKDGQALETRERTADRQTRHAGWSVLCKDASVWYDE